VKGAEYGVFDTVLMAVGRAGLAGQLNVKAAGLDYLEKNGKITVNDADQTSVSHIYAIGDVADGKPELTPVAIQAGRKLVRRLFAGSSKIMDYTDVATAVFTPIEYGAVGYSEEDAVKKLGKENVKVYHDNPIPLEWQHTLNSHRAADNNEGYMKIVCDTSQNEKVVGIHILGPNAGEIIQGLSVAIKCGLTKEILDDTVGIHPTFAEAYVGLTKTTAENLTQGGSC